MKNMQKMRNGLNKNLKEYNLSINLAALIDI